jgi:hypothetical protein
MIRPRHAKDLTVQNKLQIDIRVWLEGCARDQQLILAFQDVTRLRI